jgi:ATP-binding cassette subfamily F protein 3
LSPPIINLEGAAVGYDGRAVLKGLNQRIDQDDRIALLGRNGEGKSTLSKLLAGKLKPMSGRMTTSSRLRVGYFAQHQVDELHLDETPLKHLARARPGEMQGRMRARLAGFGLQAEQAETVVARLSGGQKARLSLLLATIHAPHLLILDEPTNHLDIDSRAALVEALTDYSGAVILVTHDMHLLSLVADRLWLVKDGRVASFDDDMDGYRRLLLAERGGTPSRRDDRARDEKPRPRPAPRGEVAPLRADVARCEARVARLEEMRAEIDGRLANPLLYSRGDSEAIAKLQIKRAEVEDGLARAEALWEAALQRLEAAGDAV